MRYYIIAGEASGDLHGSNLIRGLALRDPEAQFRLWGGKLMSDAAGVQPVKNYSQTAVMGASDVLSKLFTILSNLRFCKKDISSWKPDVVILIDYPGFNMKIARFCHRNGIKVFYYIAPKTWASRERRNRKLRNWVDKMFIVFPFEVPYFSQYNVPFEYNGNPLIDAIDSHTFETPIEGPYIAVLPGSRKGEIKTMMPVCMEVADKLGCKIVVAGAPSCSEDDYLQYIGVRGNVKLVFGKTYDILKNAEAAIINSGTASLEAALIGTPQVVCWYTSEFTYWIATKILKVQNHIKFISLGNLILGRQAFRELIQQDFSASAVYAEIKRIQEDHPYREQMLSDYEDIREALGGAGASGTVAQAMIDSLKK